MQSASSAPQENGDGDRVRKATAARQRVEAHTMWKQAFFQSRPPPACLGRLHRRQRERCNGYDLHALMQQARQCVRSECEERALRVEGAQTSKLTDSTQSNTPAEAGDAEHDSAAVPAATQRHEAWLRQMSAERTRRNPFTDLNIRSDPRRTTIMANLTSDTTDEELRVFADQFGRVLQVRVVRDRRTGFSRRYGFVEFALAAEARKAVAASRRRRLKGHAVIIDHERGRDGVPGEFLPKRLATALQVGMDAVTSSASAKPKEDGDTARPFACPAPCASATDDCDVTEMRPTVPSDDDAFLRSILDA